MIGGYSGYEVAILDVEKMADLVGGKNAFKSKINNTSGEVVFTPEYQNEPLTKLMNGIGYGCDKKDIVGSTNKSYQDLFEENYDYFGGNGGKLKIVYNAGTLSVFRWEMSEQQYYLYFTKTNVPIGDGHIYLQSHWGSGVTFSNISIEELPSPSMQGSNSVLPNSFSQFAVWLCVIFLFHFATASSIAYEGFTTHVLPNALFEGQHKPIKIEDGVNLAGLRMEGVRINREGIDLKNVNFKGASLKGGNLIDTRFFDCSFRSASLVQVDASGASFVGCDFEGAEIGGADIAGISFEQLKSTWNFRIKILAGTRLQIDFKDTDLSGFDLRDVNFYLSRVAGCKLDNTVISGGSFYDITMEQLVFTKDFREGGLLGVAFYDTDFSNKDLSKMNLTGCKFYMIRTPSKPIGMRCNMENTDFSDSVITKCDFQEVKNLTLNQIKSTWNYKHGHMGSVLLPQNIQTALDAEKEGNKTDNSN